MLGSAFAWIVLGRLVAACVGLAAIRLSTQFLAPGEYGLLVLLVSFQQWSGLFLVSPVGQYINRHTHSWIDDGSLFRRLGAYWRYVMLAAAVGALVAGIWSLQRADAATGLARALAVFVVVASTTWHSALVQLLNMSGERAAAVIWSCTALILGLAASILLVKVFPGALGWFAGQSAGLLCGALGANYSLRRVLPLERKGTERLCDRSTAWSFIVPLAFATGFVWWLVSGYRLLIEHRMGVEVLGTMAVGLVLSAQLWAVAESLASQFLFPLFLKRISGASPVDARQAYTDFLNVLGPVYVIAAAANVVAASALLKLMVSPGYASVVLFVQLGAVAELFRVLSAMLAIGMQVNGRMTWLVWPYMAGAALLAALLTFVPAGPGAINAAYALVCSLLLVTVLLVLRVRIDPGFSLDGKRWLSAAALLALSVGLLSATGDAGVQAMSIWEALAWTSLTGFVAVMACWLLVGRSPAWKQFQHVRLGATDAVGQA